MTDANTIDPVIDDSEVIRSVIQGRRDAFQTLVTRYADKVYAVAWCRLGDQDLAEEVVQETFIQAYQQLNCLKDPTKLLAWLTTIARNRSINLGMRFRNELKKRKRWALDQAVQNDIQPAEEPSPVVQKETLQETLASLSATHRESLSLFYLQGKNVQEAAAASGISAGTFKTRLHRARAALRDQLEARLETELSRLKSSDQSRRSIMAAVVAQAPGSAGLKWLSGSFLSSLPAFYWLLLGIQIVAMIPGLLMARWVMKKDFDNLRDPDGYRARLHNEATQRGLWRGVMLVPFFFLAFQSWDRYGAIALLDLIGIVFAFHFLSRLPVSKHLVTWPVFLGLLAELFFANGIVLLGWSSKPLIFINGFLILAATLVLRRRGIRMDHSVFLRMAHAEKENTDFDERDENMSKTIHWREFKGFLGYLASRQNVLSYDKNRSGYVLHWYPVKQRMSLIFSHFLPFRWPGGSSVRFDFNGSVTACLGKRDQRDLTEMGTLSATDSDKNELEAKVASALQAGYTAWLTERKDAIESHLGYEDDRTVYRTRPERAFSAKSIAIWQTLAGLFFIILGTKETWQEYYGLPRQVERMKPVTISPDDVNAFFELLREEGAGADAAREALKSWFYFGVKFPSKGDIAPAPWLSVSNQFHLQFSLDNVQARFSTPPSNEPLFGLKYFSLGTDLPWFDWIDTASLQSRDWDGHLRELSPNVYQMNGFPFRTPTKGDLMVDPTKKYFHYRLNDYRIKMEQMCRFTHSSRLDFSETIRTVASLQHLRAEQNAGMFAAEHVSELHGLFLNGGRGPIHTTWQALRLLELIGGLGAIDREACIKGFKRLYRRRGIFYLHTNHPSLFIHGDAQTTYMAFNSLRILDALDRFGDLERWEFRTPFTRQPDPKSDGSRPFSWEELEAYFMKREFVEFLAKQSL